MLQGNGDEDQNNESGSRTTLVHMPVGKEELRTSLRGIRLSLSREERDERSAAICRYLSSITGREETVLVYCAKDPEVDTCRYIDHLLGEDIPVIVPIIQRADISLRLSYITSRTSLKPSTFSVPEPIGTEIPAFPRDVTTIILPMLGFDKTGARLGYGAGYYDRFLCNHPHMKRIGIAFACQEINTIPTDSFDIRMHQIVTENGVISCEE